MNNKKENGKIIIGAVLIILACCILIGAAVDTMIFRFQNPDMTEIRIILERPESIIVALVGLVIFWIGKYMLDK